MMTTPEFDQISSAISIRREKSDPIDVTVEEELKSRKDQLEARTAICGTIKRSFKDVTNLTPDGKDAAKQPKLAPVHYAYKYICVCPRYAPKYKCEHSGNVILDRDVLTKEEHLCFLATPRKNYAAPRKYPYMYPKKVIRPSCTARIENLSKPSVKRIQENLQTYKKVLTKKALRALKGQLDVTTEEKPYMNLTKALEYIEEEKRLMKVRRGLERRRCRKMKKCILRKQRKQIRQVICILFEEMKEFLLNDQFVIDDQSPLCAVILEKIREFTDNEFYTTNNLREYQRILANNLTVWINKFVSNLNIHVTQPPQTARICEHTPEISTFLPVEDYISVSETGGEDEICTEAEIAGMEEYDNIGEFQYEENTDVTNL